jgi:hypothetical protein
MYCVRGLGIRLSQIEAAVRGSKRRHHSGEEVCFEDRSVLSLKKMASQRATDPRLSRSWIVMGTMCRLWNLCFLTLKTLKGL